MLSVKRSSLLLFSLLLTVFIAACSNPLSSSTTSSSTTTSKTTAAPKSNNATTPKSNNATTTGYGKSTGYGKTTGTASNTPTTKTTVTTQTNTTTGNTAAAGNNNAMGNTAALIHTTQVMLNGKTITVLTNAKGMVLYYKLDDPRPASACTGGCATAWPPVLVSSMSANMMVSSSIQLPRKLTVYKTANGDQVEYDGHPLYTYVGDTTPGQYTGRGMGNVWYLVALGL